MIDASASRRWQGTAATAKQLTLARKLRSTDEKRHNRRQSPGTATRWWLLAQTFWRRAKWQSRKRAEKALAIREKALAPTSERRRVMTRRTDRVQPERLPTPNRKPSARRSDSTSGHSADNSQYGDGAHAVGKSSRQLREAEAARYTAARRRIGKHPAKTISSGPGYAEQHRGGSTRRKADISLPRRRYSRRARSPGKTKHGSDSLYLTSALSNPGNAGARREAARPATGAASIGAREKGAGDGFIPTSERPAISTNFLAWFSPGKGPSLRGRRPYLLSARWR